MSRGRFEAVGRNVTRFQAGDEVFGTGDGSFAEYAAAPESTLVLKPANLTFEQAAVPTSSAAALQALRAGGINPGQQVLIVGASGGVGLFAVQIAKSFGADVTAVCSTTRWTWSAQLVLIMSSTTAEKTSPKAASSMT